jgi:hypothetical protein
MRFFVIMFLAASCVAGEVRRALPVFDLKLFSAADLRVYSGFCDSMIKEALERGDTEKAFGWAEVREKVALRINSLER